MPGEKLNKVIDMLGVFQMPGVNFLAITVKHSVHHRGQHRLQAHLVGERAAQSRRSPCARLSTPDAPLQRLLPKTDAPLSGLERGSRYLFGGREV
jgi:hypothetical protein